MADTTNPTAITSARPMRIKHAFSYGICKGTEAGVKILNSSADVVGAVAQRIKLHNVSTAADLIDELGMEKVTQAQQLLKTL